MGNAKDIAAEPNVRTLLCGLPGTGKTTQALTLPGRKFAYIFDPNALQTLRGHDIEYACFLPEPEDIDITAKSLTKNLGDKPKRKKEPLTYKHWEEDFDQRHASGFFDTVDWIIFDSFTNFLDIIMDRVLYINSRLGKQPEQSDWGAQVQTCTNVWRTLSAMDMGILACAHVDMKQNDLTKKIFYHMYVTGKLRTRLPQMFNNIWITHQDTRDGKRIFEFQTSADKEFPVVRTQWDTRPFEDATILDFKHPEQYGLGALMKRFGYSLPSRSKKEPT